MILKHFTAGASALRHAASVPESGIRNKLNLNADDDSPEGAEALKEAKQISAKGDYGEHNSALFGV